MIETLAFDDVLITPKFSNIVSRKDVNLSQTFLGLSLDLPIISSNMDTITHYDMALAMDKAGASSALHRFCNIGANVKEFYSCSQIVKNNPIVSIGIGKHELSRAIALSEAGAKHFLIDVAHGAAQHVVDQYDLLRSNLPDNAYIIVGNFATGESIDVFNSHVKSVRKPDAFKVGIGGGSMCTTRLVTGVGLSTFSSIIDCATSGYPIIADGGMRTSGDVAKALAAGASVVMLGYMLAGTDETPGDIIELFETDKWSIKATKSFKTIDDFYSLRKYDASFPVNILINKYKKYRGSASQESYKAQGKESSYISPEGESTLVEYKGPVSDILKQIEGGLRSSLSYTGSKNLTQFRESAKFIRVTQNGNIESSAHGKE